MVSLKINKTLPSFRFALFKTIAYVIALTVLLIIITYLFSWNSIEELPNYLQPYGNILFAFSPYLKYLETALIFGFGYIIINSVSGMAYLYAIEMAEKATAITLRSLVRIAGIALLLSIMTSIFNVNPAAALTVGSFGGLVVGYATQTMLSHVVAGTFLLITRPFTFGDMIKVSGEKGKVKEIKLMHVILESEDGSEDILIPSGTIVTQIIHRKPIKADSKPTKPIIKLEKVSNKVKEGTILIFKGKLIQEGGKPLVDKIVKIIETDLTKQDLLAFGKTDKNGNFSINWKAKKTDTMDSNFEIQAIFEGDSTNRACVSDQNRLKIEK